jgi:hypothetical protein
MENESENFEQLKKLLALKKHEQPPPGYFNNFSGKVVSRLRAERSSQGDPLANFEKQAPWLVRLWQALETKPMFAGAFGAAVCGVVLFGIVMSEKPVEPRTLAGPRIPMAPVLETGPAVAGAPDLNAPMMLATNQAVPDLFQMIPSGHTIPVNFTP